MWRRCSVPGFDFGLPATACFSLHPSQSVSLTASPSFPRDGFLHACLYYVMVSWWGEDANPRLFRARSLRNILNDVIIPCTKGVSANLYGGIYRQYGALVRLWLFDGYYFLVLLLATSLKMAVSTRVESSPALPPYQSPRRHDSKNTTFHIPAFDSISDAFFRAAPNSFTS